MHPRSSPRLVWPPNPQRQTYMSSSVLYGQSNEDDRLIGTDANLLKYINMCHYIKMTIEKMFQNQIFFVSLQRIYKCESLIQRIVSSYIIVE